MNGAAWIGSTQQHGSHDISQDPFSGGLANLALNDPNPYILPGAASVVLFASGTDAQGFEFATIDTTSILNLTSFTSGMASGVTQEATPGTQPFVTVAIVPEGSERQGDPVDVTLQAHYDGSSNGIRSENDYSAQYQYEGVSATLLSGLDATPPKNGDAAGKAVNFHAAIGDTFQISLSLITNATVQFASISGELKLQMKATDLAPKPPTTPTPPPSAGSHPGEITEYPISNLAAPLDQIVAGHDGNLWMTATNSLAMGTLNDAIVRLNPASGASTIFPLSPQDIWPRGITLGSDGNIWVTIDGQYEQDLKIARIAPDGSLTPFPLPMYHLPDAITAGPDGALWFTEDSGLSGTYIGRITTSGQIKEYRLDGNYENGAITAGPDGALWFADWGEQKIGRISATDGSLTMYSITGVGVSGWITVGPDNALYFSGGGDARIGRITTSGQVSYFQDKDQNQDPKTYSVREITAGPDGNLYFTTDTWAIGQLTLSGKFTLVPVTPGTTTEGITVGPDGAIWFTMPEANEVGRLVPGNLASPPAGGGGGQGSNGSGGGGNVGGGGGSASLPGSTPPMVVDAQVVRVRKGGRSRVAGFRLTFSEAMDPVRAQYLINYLTFTGNAPRRKKPFRGRLIEFQSAQYDAASHSVLLSLSRGTKLGKITEMTVAAATVESAAEFSYTTSTGLLGASGTPLAGDGRDAGTDYTVSLRT